MLSHRPRADEVLYQASVRCSLNVLLLIAGRSWDQCSKQIQGVHDLSYGWCVGHSIISESLDVIFSPLHYIQARAPKCDPQTVPLE
jgi:hypothetical protein